MMTSLQKWILPLLLLPSATAGARDLSVVDNLPHGVIVRPVDANAARVRVEAVRLASCASPHIQMATFPARPV